MVPIMCGSGAIAVLRGGHDGARHKGHKSFKGDPDPQPVPAQQVRGKNRDLPGLPGLQLQKVSGVPVLRRELHGTGRDPERDAQRLWLLIRLHKSRSLALSGTI